MVIWKVVDKHSHCADTKSEKGRELREVVNMIYDGCDKGEK